jgi:hypothetical protein
MSEGAVKNYGSGEKKAWREWQWSRIARSLMRDGILPPQALVVALVGKEATDIEVALAHGFLPENFICVERDADASRELRRRGLTVIRGDLLDVLQNWNPKGQAIDVLVADFCGSASLMNTLGLAASLSWCVHDSTVVCVNLLRGRERGDDLEALRDFQSFTNEYMRESWDTGMGLIADATHSSFVPFQFRALPSEHRGVYFFWKYLDCVREWARYGMFSPDGTPESVPAEQRAAMEDPNVRIRSLVSLICAQSEAAFSTYRSYGEAKRSSLYFDGVVFTTCLDVRPVMVGEKRKPHSNKMAKFVRAALAVRAKRLRGNARMRSRHIDGPSARSQRRRAQGRGKR